MWDNNINIDKFELEHFSDIIFNIILINIYLVHRRENRIYYNILYDITDRNILSAYLYFSENVHVYWLKRKTD